MSKPYPQEFRDDVVRVALAREPGVSLSQIASDFGVAKSALSRWLHQAESSSSGPSGRSEGGGGSELAELKRRNRLLEQENEVLRRAAAYLSQANLRSK